MQDITTMSRKQLLDFIMDFLDDEGYVICSQCNTPHDSGYLCPGCGHDSDEDDDQWA